MKSINGNSREVRRQDPIFSKIGQISEYDPKAIVIGSVERRGTLNLERCFFNSIEVKFPANNISNFDDYHFPRCNSCQCWGHWEQRCPTKLTKCAFCGLDHHSSKCSRARRHCSNCDSGGHCAFSKKCDAFKKYIAWAQVQGCKDASSSEPRTLIQRSRPSTELRVSSTPCHTLSNDAIRAYAPTNVEPSRDGPPQSSRQDYLEKQPKKFSDQVLHMVDLWNSGGLLGITRLLSEVPHIKSFLGSLLNCKNTRYQGFDRYLSGHIDTAQTMASSRTNWIDHGISSKKVGTQRNASKERGRMRY
ncbi:hypothetical protein ACOME3_003779 [Neoechinorhynchus agilis]